MLARVRPRLGVVIGAALVAEFWGELAFAVPAGTPHRALAALLLAALAAALVGGRRAPLAGVLLAFGALALLTALSDAYFESLFLPLAGPFVAAFWLGRSGSPRAVAVVALPCVALCLLAPTIAEGLAAVAISFVAPVVVGRHLRSRAALSQALRGQAAVLERHRDDAADRAVTDERTRIAGELHDVVAHALAAMTVQATGARRLALTRPELARAAFAAIESSGREALDELRRLLGVLRTADTTDDDAGGATRAAPLEHGRATAPSRGPAQLRETREVFAALALVTAGLAAFNTDLGAWVLIPIGGALAWLAVRATRSRARLTAALHDTAAQLAAANADALREAATAERSRIARELHDLVAHSMSVMVVQAGGARRILDRDPARALEAATRIERAGREALGEMRHLLGVLNGSGQPPQLAPQPTLAEIGELVTRARAAGLPTTLEYRGERRPLAAGLDLAAYRIVQEGLTNALKHAGRAPTTVLVDWSEAETLTLEIRDLGAPHAANGTTGHGLVGMRERVKLYGGELATGPDDGGGWRIRATLPMIERELSVA